MTARPSTERAAMRYAGFVTDTQEEGYERERERDYNAIPRRTAV